MFKRPKLAKSRGLTVKTSEPGGTLLKKRKYSAREVLQEQSKAQAEHQLNNKLADQMASTSNQDTNVGEDYDIDITMDAPTDSEDGYSTDGDSDDEQGIRMFMGEEGVDISHAGGEFDKFFDKMEKKKKKSIDWRTRRNRTQARVDAFRPQLQYMVDSYISWCDGSSGLDDLGRTPPDSDDISEFLCITTVDTYNTAKVDVPILNTQKNVAAALIRQGIIPCSPFTPSVGITIRVLELFRLAQLRSPGLSIQSWVKALSDVHDIPWRGYASEQFSICFDVYLEIRRIVRRVVLGRLGRAAPNWRLANACPPCMYQMEDETPEKIGFLFTMDGNDSLKRVERRSKGEDTGESDVPQLGASRERRDDRDCRGDYILRRDIVDQWGKDVFDTVTDTLLAEDDIDDGTLCSARWTNARNEFSAKMWGIFEETGIFVALCRHSFVLVAADMVRSGELSKYALAVLQEILSQIDPRLGAFGGGYDIGCHFKKTVKKSPLASLAEERMFKSLVGLFHGHAHNRLCQTEHLGTYVDGLGLENLEGCERFFSLSNRLASSMRYASRFHRWQTITGYFQHMDRIETYASLSSLLVANYTHALQVLDSHKHFMKNLRLQKIDNPDVIKTWLDEEKQYLQSLKKEPQTDTWKMDYLDKLKELRTLELELKKSRQAFIVETPATMVERPGKRRRTVDPERTFRQTVERHGNVVCLVQDFESKLDIRTRWLPGTDEWRTIDEKAVKRDYQRALDHLEGLVVSRIFELAKMNMGGTGYKLRKHIAKALQSRSQSIRTAVQKYNTAAASMTPPRELLKAKNVVEYAFLGQFDLLRGERSSLEDKPWATPVGRLLLDQYYKLLRAEETRERLNKEIVRFVTQMRDEDDFLLRMEEETRLEDPGMAFQIAVYRRERSRFNPTHHRRLLKLSQKQGFTGSLTPGKRLAPLEDATTGDDPSPMPAPTAPPSHSSTTPPTNASTISSLPSDPPTSPRIVEARDASMEGVTMPKSSSDTPGQRPPVRYALEEDWGDEDAEGDDSDEERDLEATFHTMSIATDAM